MDVARLTRRGVREITPYVPGQPIETVQRVRGLRRVLKLASNENALGPSPRALAAIRRELRAVHRYPDGSGFALKQRLAHHHGLDASAFVLGNGSDELVTLMLRAFLNEGDEVVLAKPTFLIYELAARLAHAEVITVPLTHELRYDLPAMRRAISVHTKLVFIANPDNPTGSYITDGELAAFMLGLPPHVIVVFDEAYFEYREAPDYPDTTKYLHSHNVLITRTFSKAYGLAGLRIGYGVARPDLTTWVERVREPFNVNRLAQCAALAALDDVEHLRRTQTVTWEGKAYLAQQCERLGLRAVPSQANFLLIEVGPRAAIVAERLVDRGILVRDLHPWGLDRYLRVTIGLPRENRRVVKALRRVLRQVC